MHIIHMTDTGARFPYITYLNYTYESDFFVMAFGVETKFKKRFQLSVEGSRDRRRVSALQLLDWKKGKSYGSGVSI